MATQILTQEQVLQEERKWGIGGSDVHHLFPMLDLDDDSDTGSPYGCPRMLAYEKLAVAPDYHHSPETLRIFKRGHAMEGLAADEYAEATGRKIWRSNQMLVSKQYPWMIAHIDRWIKADDRGRGVFEAKSASEFAFARMKKSGLPLMYSLQLTHYFIVPEVEWGAFGVIQPDSFEFLHFEMERNPDLCELVIDKEHSFWHLIEQKKLPDPLPQLSDDRCKECLYRKTCRGAEYDRLNDRLIRDREGVKYVQISATDGEDSPNSKLIHLTSKLIEIKQTVANLEDIEKGYKLELQQNFPAGRGALIFPSLNGAKLRWKEQVGARRWDSSALDGDAAMLSEKLGFDFLAHYKRASAPTRPFVLTPGKEQL